MTKSPFRAEGSQHEAVIWGDDQQDLGIGSDFRSGRHRERDCRSNSRNRLSTLLLVWACLLATSCSGQLDHSQARGIIEEHSLIRKDSDAITVEAISQERGKPEAIVRATIAGVSVNLKFRRYDSGWRWEFIETAGGGWIAPDNGMPEIREADRQRRVKAWVAANRDAYRQTKYAISMYSDNLPRPGQTFDVRTWLKQRKWYAEFLETVTAGKPSEKLRAGIIELRKDAIDDAWGSEIQVYLDASERIAGFLSIGPDKQKGTPDDVMCVVHSQQNTVKDWVVPEGLNEVVAPEVSGDNPGRVQYVPVIQP